MLRVTEALALVGLVDTTHMNEDALVRGRAVHLATELADAGTLDEESVDPVVAPYLASWRRWRAASGVAVVASEVEVEHQPMGYAGRLDRVAMMPSDDRPRILDIKTGGSCAWHPIQTALYAMAYALGKNGPTPLRGAVYLKADGSAADYRPHSERRDFDVAKAVVTLAHFLKRSS